MANRTISLFRRDTHAIAINVTDSAGDVIDITGYTFYFTVKTLESDADGSALIQKTVTSHNDPTNGQTTITLDTSDTNQTPGEYFYDLQMKDTLSQITTISKDAFRVKQDITVTTS